MEDMPMRVEQDKVLHSWTGPVRPYQKKNIKPLVVPIIISVLVSLILIAAGEFMLVLVVAALVFVWRVWSVVKPVDVQYTISTRGIKVGTTFVEWGLCTRWWTEDQMGHEVAFVEVPAQFPGRLMLLAESETEISKIKKVLERMLLMEKPLETGAEKAGKWLNEKFPLSSGS